MENRLFILRPPRLVDGAGRLAQFLCQERQVDHHGGKRIAQVLRQAAGQLRTLGKALGGVACVGFRQGKKTLSWRVISAMKKFHGIINCLLNGSFNRSLPRDRNLTGQTPAGKHDSRTNPHRNPCPNRSVRGKEPEKQHRLDHSSSGMQESAENQ